MTYDAMLARAQLRSKIAEAREKKVGQADPGACDHEWKKYRQRIQPREEYEGPPVYFIVMGCEKCKTKRHVDMVRGV